MTQKQTEVTLAKVSLIDTQNKSVAAYARQYAINEQKENGKSVLSLGMESRFSYDLAMSLDVNYLVQTSIGTDDVLHDSNIEDIDGFKKHATPEDKEVLSKESFPFYYENVLIYLEHNSVGKADLLQSLEENKNDFENEARALREIAKSDSRYVFRFELEG